MKVNNIEYGNRIAFYRTQLNMSRKDLEIELKHYTESNVNRYVLHQIESGRSPRFDLTPFLSQIFGVPTLCLLYGEILDWLPLLLNTIIEDSNRQFKQYDEIIEWVRRDNPDSIDLLLIHIIRLDPVFFVPKNVKLNETGTENQNLNQIISRLSLQLFNWNIEPKKRAEWIEVLVTLLSQGQDSQVLLELLNVIAKVVQDKKSGGAIDHHQVNAHILSLVNVYLNKK